MFEKILVPIDGSALAAAALSHALAIGQPEACLTLFRVIESSSDCSDLVNPVNWQLQRTEASAYLDELGNNCEWGGVIEKTVQEGPAAERILEEAQEHGHDLIVISSHGRSGLSDWNISSITNKVINRSGIAVLLVRSYKLPETPATGPVLPVQYRRILVPLDGSVRSEYVLPAAIRLAKQHGAELLLVHGVVKPELFQQVPLDAAENSFIDRVIAHNKQQAENYLNDLARRLDIEVQTHVLTSDDVAESLHRFVEEQPVDLVVLNAHGRSGKHIWPYGSVAASFIAYGTTHLLVIQDRSWQDVTKSRATKAMHLDGIPPIATYTVPTEKGSSHINAFATRQYNATYSAR